MNKVTEKISNFLMDPLGEGFLLMAVMLIFTLFVL